MTKDQWTEVRVPVDTTGPEDDPERGPVLPDGADEWHVIEDHGDEMTVRYRADQIDHDLITENREVLAWLDAVKKRDILIDAGVDPDDPEAVAAYWAKVAA